ncbi:ATP-grasp domain-containing protein [Ktedonospora formicarum]|uniref:ATP-grasp domain-containing protein n=1 Tax=Ktedonospora formicarum TaxID=2778364 RepID=A0A8J3MR46_9CHLR|nr:ATP-grasp domain-containing protein [Ktedonospora formicarum]GHO43288.1 hypothetical protein KSX_14510 [Ktedonospora formicarum]
MAQRQEQPGVVVLGSDFKALGVVRSLGRQGIPCVLVDNVPRSAWFSRYTVKRLTWKGPHLDGPDFLSFLLSICKAFHLDQWLVFPTDDAGVGFVAHHRDELAQCYRLVTQDWHVIRWAHDKRLTYSMAQEVGVSAPRTWYPSCEADLASLEIEFPVLLKPAISINLQHAVRAKALPAETHDELRTSYRQMVSLIPHNEIMLQEIIPGQGRQQFSVATFCKEGEVLLSMTARRTRQYPIHYGLGSSFVEAVAVPEIEEMAAKLIRHMGITGMVEVEFKQDPRTGEYKVLDINPRPWGWHTLCVACGFDFPLIQYRDLMGERPQIAAPRYGYRWLRVLTDLPAGIQEIRAGQLSVLAYLRSLFGKTVFSVLDWRDPLPALGDLAIALRRAANGSFKQKV